MAIDRVPPHPAQVPAATGKTGAKPGGKNDVEAARKTGQEFEAMFLSQMISQMFQGVGNDKLFGGGEAGKLYQSMMQEEYGKVISKGGGIGVADQITREVLKLQEKANK